MKKSEKPVLPRQTKFDEYDEYDEGVYGEDVDAEDDDDDGTCPACAGTGEGQFDGQRCLCCRGWGY